MAIASYYYSYYQYDCSYQSHCDSDYNDGLCCYWLWSWYFTIIVIACTVYYCHCHYWYHCDYDCRAGCCFPFDCCYCYPYGSHNHDDDDDDGGGGGDVALRWMLLSHGGESLWCVCLWYHQTVQWDEARVADARWTSPKHRRHFDGIIHHPNDLNASLTALDPQSATGAWTSGLEDWDFSRSGDAIDFRTFGRNGATK